MLFSKKKDIRLTQLKKIKKTDKLGRLDIVLSFMKDINKLNLLNKSKYNIELKKYEFSLFGNDIFDKAKKVWFSRMTKTFHSDGLIFTPITEYYPKQSKTWPSLFKWKPPELNTIDFLIKFKRDNKKNIEVFPYITNEKDTDVKFKKYVTVELYVGGKNTFYDKSGKMFKKYGKKLFNPLNQEDNIYSTTNLFIDLNDSIISTDPLSGDTDNVLDDTIVEFSYNKTMKEGFRWTPIRTRYDKTNAYKKGEKVFGNDERTANDIFKSYKVPVLEEVIITGKISEELMNKYKKYESLEKSNSQFNSYYTKETSNKNYKRSKYQNFHNLVVKDSLYNDAKLLLTDKENKKIDINLMEFASGRGGDISRWKKYNFKKVIGIEPVMASIEEAKDRFSKASRPKPKTYFLRGDLSKLIFPNYEAGNTEADKINLKKFLPLQYEYDILSIQFAIHYLFKDEVSVRTIMQNMNDNLKTGGIVIGTCFDGERIFNKLKKSKKINGVDKNGDLLWSIEKKYNIRKLAETKNSLGKEISVFVKNIGQEHNEYLVNYNYLDKLFEEYGFKKIKVESFEEIYDKNDYELEEVEKEFSFMYNTFVYQK